MSRSKEEEEEEEEEEVSGDASVVVAAKVITHCFWCLGYASLKESQASTSNQSKEHDANTFAVMTDSWDVQRPINSLLQY